MTRIEFRKTFTKGHLSGVSVKDRLTCVGMKEALDWVKRVNENTEKGYVDFFISEITYVEVL